MIQHLAATLHGFSLRLQNPRTGLVKGYSANSPAQVRKLHGIRQNFRHVLPIQVKVHCGWVDPSRSERLTSCRFVDDTTVIDQRREAYGYPTKAQMRSVQILLHHLGTQTSLWLQKMGL